MRKKILSVLLAVVIMLCGMVTPSVGVFDDLTPDAQAAEYDGFSYYVNSGSFTTVTVNGYSGDDEVVNIPSYINGYLVNTIGPGTTDWENAVTINIPDTVKKISSYAFTSCEKLTTVNFGAGVCSIGEEVFLFTDISEFNVSSANKYLYTIDGVLFNKYDELVAYPTAKTNTHYTVPSGTSAILQSAFDDCEALESVTIPASVEVVGDCAFNFCSKLTTVNIADSVKRIGVKAFAYTGITEFDFPENLTSIGDYAFESTDLTQAYLPSKVSDIGSGILANCPIESISVSRYSSYLCTVDGILFSKDMKRIYQYPDAKVATSYTVPDGVEEIWGGAFDGADITSVSLPDGLKKIGGFAFALSKLDMDVLTIPDSVTEIATMAFYACEIEKAYIGERVKYIGGGAFSKTMKAYFKGNGVNVVDELGQGAFPKVLDEVSLFYPEGDSTWTSELLVDRYNWGTWDTPVHRLSNVSEASITLSKTSYEFNNIDCRPLVTVKLGTETLREGKDYKLKYANNFYPGTASVTITGINDYEGEVKKTFTITKSKTYFYASLSSDEVHVGETAKVLTNLTRGEVRYKSSNTACATVDSYGNITAKAKGTTKITVTVLENDCYTGATKSVTLKVVPVSNKKVDVSTLTYSFGNNRKTYGYSNPYRISKSKYKLFYYGNEINEAYKWFGDWGGNCAGMSISSIMFNTNDNEFDVTDFKSSAKKVSDLTVSNRSSQHNMTVTDFIETMHITQYRDEVHKSRRDTENDIQDLFDKVKLTKNGGAPVYISVYDGYDACHAIVGYKTEKISSKESRIYVYDCNYPKKERWIKVYTNSSGECTGWYYEINDKYKCGSNYSGSEIQYVPYEIYKHIWENRNTGTSARSSACARSSMTVNSDNFEICSESGEVLAVMKDGVFESYTEEIYEARLAESENISEIDHTILMPTCEYKIVNTDTENYELELTMSNDDQSVDITTVAESVDVNVDSSRDTNIVDISDDGATYKVEVENAVSEDDTETVVYKGKCGEDEVSVGMSDNELVAQNYSNSAVVVNNDYTNFTSESDIDISTRYYISLSEYSFYTDGLRKTPEIQVKSNFGYADLIEGVDYEVVYKDNLQSGTATIEVYGINDYKGCVKETFRIYDGIYAPKSLSYTAKAGEVKLSWKAVSDADGYDIQQYKDNEWLSVEKAENGDIEECTIKDLSASENYKFRVRAYIATGIDVCYGKFSSEIDTKTSSASTPKITKVENVKGGAKITWKEIDGADKYTVFRKSGSSWKKVGTTVDTEYIHNISKSNTAYTYTVRCVKSDEKTYTSSYNKTGVKNTYIAQPEISKFENVNGGTKISWGKVAGAKKYRLFKKTNGKWTTVATTSSTSYTHKISKSNTTTEYTVRCMDSKAKKYTSSYNTTGYSNKYIATPKLKAVSNTSKGVKFSFYKVSGAPKYRVYRKTGSGSWKKLADVSNKYDYYVDKTAKKGVKYRYTVRCVSSSGKSYVSGYNSTGLAITRK